MTGADFDHWLAAMKAAGLAQDKGAAALALGISRDTLTRYVQNGAPRSIALACAALLGGLEPYAAAAARD